LRLVGVLLNARFSVTHDDQERRRCIVGTQRASQSRLKQNIIHTRQLPLTARHSHKQTSDQFPMVKESQKVWKKLTSLEPRRANGVDTHGTLEWFEAHQSHPYPTNVDKASLEAATGLGPQQSTIGSQMLGDGVLAICRLLLSAMGMAARMRETTTSLPWPQQRYTSARFVTVSLLQSTTGSATR
jgi:hypothetical protein